MKDFSMTFISLFSTPTECLSREERNIIRKKSGWFRRESKKLSNVIGSNESDPN